MELLYVLLVLLVLTRTFGELAERVGQPALVGELIAGVALGLLVIPLREELPVLATLDTNEVFIGLTELGIFFLMLYAGVELRPRDLARASTRSAAVAAAGMLVPFALGFGLGWAVLPESGLRSAQCLFLGVALAITAVPVAVRVLLDLGHLDAPLGRLVVSAALIDDVLSLVLLAVLTAVIQSGAMPGGVDLLLLAGRVCLFFGCVVVWGRVVMPVLGRRIHRLRSDEFELSFLLISGLALALAAEALSMHFILGAFAAGLFFGRSTVDSDVYEGVERRLSGITSGFLAPIFFASIGYHMDPAALVEVPVFALGLLALATLGKVVGAGVPAALSGLSRREAVGVGFAMNARGAVELVIADIALRHGLFEGDAPVVEHMYSAVVVMAIVTTLVTPPVLGRVLGRASGD